MSGLDFFAEPVAEGLTNFALSLLPKMAGKAAVEAKKIFSSASQKYVSKYKNRHCILKIIGMSKPMSLDNIYTGVKLLNERDVFQFSSIDALEARYRKTRFGGYAGTQNNTEKDSGIKVANENQYLMVLGGPGAGKSTFLRKVGLESLKTLHYENTDYHHRCLPVLLDLKRFESDSIDIELLITKEFKTCEFPEAEKFTHTALEQGKLLILFDGLDEVPTANLNNVIHTIQDFVDRYDQNRFIASCRTAAYRGSFTRFKDAAMADFDDEQIKEFINNWFSNELDVEQKTGEKCWEILQSPDNASAKELAHTPLLLSFLCLAYDKSQRLPANRSILYKRALRILMEEWSALKRINRDKIYEGLSVELEEELLSEIAYYKFEADQLFFSKRELIKQIKKFLTGNLNVPKTLDGESILLAIEVQQGLLVERAEDTYSFSHLTLQEYLTAQYLIDNNQWKDIIINHITERRWREVILLLPGLSAGRQGSNSLLRTMEDTANGYLQSDKIKRLLGWATKSTKDSAGSIHPAVKRICALFLVFNLYYDRPADFDIAQNLAFSLIFCDSYTARAWLSGGHRNVQLVSESDIALVDPLDRVLMPMRVLANNKSGDPSSSMGGSFAMIKDLSELRIFTDINLMSVKKKLEELTSITTFSKSTKKQKQWLRESFFKIWFDALGISFEEIRLSRAECRSMLDYFYICKLMVECKEAAVRVSPDVWSGIESRIATAPTNESL